MNQEARESIASEETSEPLPNIVHRLVGAGVLVVFAVVVLPFILNGANEQNGRSNFDRAVTQAQDDSFAITPKNSDIEIGRVVDPHGAGSTDQRRVHISQIVPDQARHVDESATPVAQTVKPGIIIDSVTSDSVQQPDQSKSVRLKTIDEALKDDAPKAETSKSETLSPADSTQAFDRGYVVRVGTFAIKENAERVVEKLLAAGFSPQTTTVVGSEQTVTRVWVGPFRDRVTAGRTQNRIEQATSQVGFIADYPES